MEPKATDTADRGDSDQQTEAPWRYEADITGLYHRGSVLQACGRVGQNPRSHFSAVASSCEQPKCRSDPSSSRDQVSLAGFFLSVVPTDFLLHVLLLLILEPQRHSHGQRRLKESHLRRSRLSFSSSSAAKGILKQNCLDVLFRN